MENLIFAWLQKTKISKDTKLRYDYGDKHNQSWRGVVCHRFFQALLDC